MDKISENAHTDPFWYDLPIDRIAQRPLQPAEAARLLVVASKRDLEQSTFADIGSYLRSGDLLVFNQTRVAPARIRGVITAAGVAEVELLLVERQAENSYRCMARPLKKLPPGTEINFRNILRGVVDERTGEREILVSLSSIEHNASVADLLDTIGEMPIPPYIRKGRADDQDRGDYQSIFAEIPGSIAAPTASLHFSENLVAKLTGQGIETAGVTLHLGTASFLPIFYAEHPTEIHPPGTERYMHSNRLLDKIVQVRARGNRVFAIGTSVVRALESMIRKQSEEGDLCDSQLFIRPGFEFKALDGIVTNFHQPGTTHLLLVEAFTGKELLATIYQYALQRNFRFLSYGDGMVLLPEEQD